MKSGLLIRCEKVHNSFGGDGCEGLEVLSWEGWEGLAVLGDLDLEDDFEGALLNLMRWWIGQIPSCGH
jgi:hypothetical protein